MHLQLAALKVTNRGVTFNVDVGNRKHECMISKATLDRLAAKGDIDTSDSHTVDVFRAFESTIAHAARQLIVQGPAAGPFELNDSVLGLDKR